jgi:uncharacterized protein YceK
MLKKILILLVALTVLSGCATVSRQAYNKDASQQIRKIAIAEPDDKETIGALIVAHPGTGFGLIGGLIAAADMQEKSNRITTALNPEKTRLRHRFVTDLSASLNNLGYETEIVPISKGLDEKRAISTLKEKTKSDAVIIADVSGLYIAAGPTTPYAPFVRVKIKAESSSDSKVLYEDTITWGYSFAGNSQTVHLSGGDFYHYEDVGAIVSSADQAREALWNGVNAITAQISNDLKRN